MKLATASQLNDFLRHEVPSLCKKYKRPPQTPRMVADPIEKADYVLVPDNAIPQNLDRLQSLAQAAELNNRLDEAWKLWTRYNTASKGTGDHAAQAFARIGRRMEAMKPIPASAWSQARRVESLGLRWAGRIEMRDSIGREPQIQGSFCLGLCPVTTEQFEEFVKDGGFDRKELWTEPGWAWFEREGSPDKYNARLSPPDHPRILVCWHEAMAFARWLNKTFTAEELGIPPNWSVRLPVEAEWQRAAQHTDNRLFPWGNSAAEIDSRCNCPGLGLRKTSIVGGFPQGKAVCGAEDLAGNVYEWCLDSARGGFDLTRGMLDSKAARGGSFKRGTMRCVDRVAVNANWHGEDIGFRLVASSSAPSGLP
jgi:hypothetical protein